MSEVRSEEELAFFKELETLAIINEKHAFIAKKISDLLDTVNALIVSYYSGESESRQHLENLKKCLLRAAIENKSALMKDMLVSEIPAD